MELPNIGEHCSVKNCNRLDFLPFKCACKIIFCREHFKEHALDCESAKIHVEVVQGSEQPAVRICSNQECKKKVIHYMLCEKCNEYFCIHHRHHGCYDSSKDAEIIKEKNELTQKQFEEAKAVVDEEVNSKLKKSKNRAVAQKVQLMKLKGKAVGEKSIPVNERIHYLIVYKNKSDQKMSSPLFVSKKWTLGKSIDSLATFCNLQNNNNDASKPKLRLFLQDGTEISKNMSDTFEKLLENNTVFDGDCLIFDYIKNNCDLSVNYDLLK